VDDVAGLVAAVGSDHVAFGSDYPHPEGLAEPLEYFSYLDKAGMGDADQKLIMSDNANRLLRLTP
jgi:predicted TIM-barrel fold metal-dependent hydrolase